jgi:hypothetical protein
MPVKPFVSSAPVPSLPIGDQVVEGLHKAIWTIAANGFTYGNSVLIGPWISPQAGMADWSVRVTQVDGDAITQNAGLGVWLPMTSDHSWGYLTAGTAETSDLFVEFSEDGGATVAASITVVLIVQSDEPPSDSRRGTTLLGRQQIMQ